MASERARLARVAGLLYAVVIAAALFAEVGARGAVRVDGDPAATAARLVEHAGLFRLGVLADLLAFVCDAVLAALLFVLLRPAGRTLALAAAALRLTGTAVYALNLLHAHAALAVLGPGGPAAFPPEQREALAAFLLELHATGYDLGLVFFGAHCLLLGGLLGRATGGGRWLGFLLGAGGVVYLLGSTMHLHSPAAADALVPLYAVPLLAEVALSLWLLSGRPR